MTLADQKAAELIGQAARDLHHPIFVGLCCDARDVTDALGQFNDEKHIIGDQSAQGADSDGEQVRRHDAAPMRLEKHLPWRAPASLGRGLDSFALKYIGNGAPANLVSQVVQRTLNARVPQLTPHSN